MNRKIFDMPDASARIKGSAAYPDVSGLVSFYQLDDGVFITAEIFDLPQGDPCQSGVFGFHIHEGISCTGNTQDPFSDAKGHYNPKNCPHPYHAGDLPPLFGNNGYAYMSVLTNRFTVSEIIGRVVIIHEHPDDFMTQPSGNSGAKIACGKISSP